MLVEEPYKAKKFVAIRYCEDCGKLFHPTAKLNFYCRKCLLERYDNSKAKMTRAFRTGMHMATKNRLAEGLEVLKGRIRYY
jgi:uncharacterized OB-fold protein